LCDPGAIKSGALLAGAGSISNPQSHHAGQQLKERFDMKHPALDTPIPETVNGDTLFHGNDPILMPAQGPVRLRCLVEQYGSDRPAIVTQYGKDESTASSSFT
jgi:hypothetical protein